MSRFKNLQENISEIQSLLFSMESEIKSDPTNFSLRVNYNSFQNQLSDLQDQLRFENLKREKEILSLRFLGEIASFGSFPLDHIGNLTNSFSSAIFSTSFYKMYGNKGGKKRFDICRNTIDLRLEGVGKGSTIFYLSGKVSPDLFGNSTIQNVLEDTFSLLNSQSVDEITDKISGVGHKSIKYISKFLGFLTSDKLEISINWLSPRDIEYKWSGSKDNIKTLYNTLNKIVISFPEEISFVGELITISSKGKFEILTTDNHRLFGTFSSDLLSSMKQFHIGDSCKGIIIKTTISNPLSDKEKYEFLLKEIY